jgi:acylphosphatase
MSKVVSCDFEVFGKVQGVYFRKYTEKQAIILGLRGDKRRAVTKNTTKIDIFLFAGWCMNTTNGTVKGRLEGDEGRMRQMMDWLKTTGSPKSKITKAVFSEPKPIREFTVRNFTVKR